MEGELLVEHLESHGYKLITNLLEAPHKSVYKVNKIENHIQYIIIRWVYNQDMENYIHQLAIHDHLHCAKIYDSWKLDSYIFVVMEFCYNGSIVSLINSGVHLNRQKFSIWGKQAIEGLQSLHKEGIAHRNINPSCLLLDEYYRVKIANYGFKAKTPEEIWNEGQSDMVAYMAPECFDNKPYDPFLADIWSLGAAFYTLVTGRPPFPISNLEKLKSQIKDGTITYPSELSHDIVKVLSSMMQVNPTQRSIFNVLQNKMFLVRRGTKKITNSASAAFDAGNTIIQLTMGHRSHTFKYQLCADIAKKMEENKGEPRIVSLSVDE